MAKSKDDEFTGGRGVVSKDSRRIEIIAYILVGVFALLCLIPFYLVVIASFTSETSLIRDGYPIFPTSFSLESYALCLKNPISILRAYANTAGVTIVGTACAILIATMTGYVLSRKDFPGETVSAFSTFSPRCSTADWFPGTCSACGISASRTTTSVLFFR